MMKTLTKFLFTIVVLLSTPKTIATMEANIKHTTPTSTLTEDAPNNVPLVKADNIPNENTAFKTWMPYTAITNTASLQYRLQQDAHTDGNGLRVYNNKYMVAVGTVYGSVGDTVTVTLDTGLKFDCIIGDSKGNRVSHNIYNNQGEFISANIVEFIVDKDKLNRAVKMSGDVSSIDKFKGEVISIEKL